MNHKEILQIYYDENPFKYIFCSFTHFKHDMNIQPDYSEEDIEMRFVEVIIKKMNERIDYFEHKTNEMFMLVNQNENNERYKQMKEALDDEKWNLQYFKDYYVS
jgi:hypothetical protein